MAQNKKSKVSPVDILDNVDTLEDYFDLLDAGYKKFIDRKVQMERKVVDDQKKAMLNFADEYARKRQQLDLLGIKNLEAYRKKLLDDFNKKKTQEDLKLMNEALKAQYDIQTSFDKKRQAEERRARDQQNQELLEFYKQLEAQGVKLTAEQQAERAKAQQEHATTSAEGKLNKALGALTAAVNKLDGSIDKYAQYGAGINARLQGSGTTAERVIWGQNRFGAIESNITTAIGVNPYFKTETMLDNLQALVEAGIASNIEQRAFLQTAKDDIATTFDAANGALLRIIRLQQNDSTAVRLGMEAYLTRFLNELVENTEYLTQTFDNVQEALIEASSIMGAKASTEFEYIVQKWLGALTGTGLSEATATNIAQALGALGSGNVTGISDEMLSLVTMAASRAGLDIGDILNTGLSAEITDTLLNSLASYMVEIGETTSNVVRSQLAQTFGLSVSDIQAATQLSSSFSDIQGKFLTYGDMYNELYSQMMYLPQRINMASMIDTIWSNLEFGLASNIAKNPALAAIWKVTGLIQEQTGGINVPTIMAMGSGFDLNTTIENLIRLGVVGVSSLGMIGDLVSGLSSTLVPSSMLAKLGITELSTGITRGTGLGSRKSGISLSESSVTRSPTMPSSGEDIGESALTKESDKQKQKVEQEKGEDDSLAQIKSYLVETFQGQFTQMLGYMKEVRDKVVDGEIEVSNYKQSDNFIPNATYGSLLF